MWLPLPLLEEQKRIVAVLDQAFAALDRARALAEANLADAEALLSQTVEAASVKARSGEPTAYPGIGTSDLLSWLSRAIQERRLYRWKPWRDPSKES